MGGTHSKEDEKYMQNFQCFVNTSFCVWNECFPGFCVPFSDISLYYDYKVYMKFHRVFVNFVVFIAIGYFQNLTVIFHIVNELLLFTSCNYVTILACSFFLLSLAPQPSLGLGLLLKIRLNFLEPSQQFSVLQGRVVSPTPNPHPGGPGLCIYIPQRQGGYPF
jgi:hypothetical protein